MAAQEKIIDFDVLVHPFFDAPWRKKKRAEADIRFMDAMWRDRILRLKAAGRKLLIIRDMSVRVNRLASKTEERLMKFAEKTLGPKHVHVYANWTPERERLVKDFEEKLGIPPKDLPSLRMHVYGEKSGRCTVELSQFFYEQFLLHTRPKVLPGLTVGNLRILRSAEIRGIWRDVEATKGLGEYGQGLAKRFRKRFIRKFRPKKKAP